MSARDVRSIAVIAAAVAVVSAAVLLRPTEERRVRKRLESIAATLGVPAHDGDLARLARSNRVRACLTPDVSVDFEGGQIAPIRDRDAVAGLVARAWVWSPAGVRVELREMEVSVGDDRVHADARFEARVVSLDPGADPPLLDARLVSLTLAKVEGEWLVRSVRVMRSDDSVRAP